MSEALLQYKIRISPKAKNPRLRVTLRHGLEVVVPKGYDNAKVPAILDRKRHWIRAALERTELNRKFIDPEPEWQLPTRITLSAIGRTWHVESRASQFDRVAVREIAPRHLLVFGNIGDEKACIAALQRWLHRQANESLVSILERISEKTGLRFSRVFIKRQRTRWASCSRNRAISLNVKLLFLEPDLVEYSMTHELCHIKEMNHSKKFWSLVQHHSPDYKQRDHRLRDAWKSLPRWVH
jgi:hypothetical protein